MKEKIIFLATYWGRKYGGINPFNKDLCCALAKLLKNRYKIECVVISGDSDEIALAEKNGVLVIQLDPSEQTKEFEEKHIKEIIKKVNNFNDEKVMWWIGHDIITGSLAINVSKHSKSSQVAIIHHMNYEAYKGYSQYDDTQKKIKTQKDILSDAELVFAIGPKLCRSANDKIRGEKELKIVKLIPGLAEIEGEDLPSTFSAIAFGRLDPQNDIIKQFSLVVAAFGKVLSNPSKPLGYDPNLTLYGLSENNLKDETKELKELAHKYSENKPVSLYCNPHTNNEKELFDALREKSVCLMPSLHEGFGLVGWEAIAAEVPLIVTENSGLYETISELLKGEGIGCLKQIEVKGSTAEENFSSEDLESVSNALIAIHKDGKLAKTNARLLKQNLKEKNCTWEHTARTMAKACNLDLPDIITDGIGKNPPSQLLEGSDQPKFRQIGRDDYFNKIQNIIHKNGQCLIYGMPGIGKSFMASKIYDKFSNEGFNCDWIQFGLGYWQKEVESYEGYELSLDKLLIRINVKVGNNLTIEEKENILEEKLKNNHIIMFVDDIESPDEIRRFIRLSRISNTPLLVTSQKYDTESGLFEEDNCVYLQKLNRKYAIELFKLRAKLKFNNQEEDLIKKICKDLEYHPFAISVVASLCKYIGIIELYNELSSNIAIIDKDSRHKKPLLSFKVAFNKLENDVKGLFTKIAILSTRQLSYNLLKTFPDYKFENLTDLIDRGLLELRHNEKIVMHKLVQECFKKYCKKPIYEIEKEIIKKIEEYLDENKYWDIETDRNKIKNEIENILTAMEWYEDKDDYINLIKMESRMRHFFYVLGYWQERRKWSEKVYQLRDKHDLLLIDYGHEIIMAGIEGLGFAYINNYGDNEKANKIADDANKIIDQIGKDESGRYRSKGWERAKCFYYRIKGLSEINLDRNLKLGVEFLEKAYDLADKSKWESMKVAIGINLGEAYLKLKKVDIAIKIFEDSEELALKTDPPQYRRNVNALVDIGITKIIKLNTEFGNSSWDPENSDVREAINRFQKALKVDKKHIRDEPFIFYKITKNIGELLSHIKKVQVENLFEKLQKRIIDLDNLKKINNWDLDDYAKIREETEIILDDIFKYFEESNYDLQLKDYYIGT